MDFYITESEELKKEVDYKEDRILKPYLTSVNSTIFQEYLKSNEYNDPTIRKMISIKLYQSPNYVPICEETIDNKKLK